LKIIKSLDAYQKETEKNNGNQVGSQSQASVNTQNNTEANTTSNSSNVTTTNLPITNQSNVTTTGNIKTDSSNSENSTQPHNDRKIERPNSFHDKNSNFSSTPLSNVTAANLPIINKSNSIQSHKDKKIDQPSSFHDNNLNQQQDNSNKTGSPVIPQGSFDSEQQNVPHDKGHEKIQVKQNKGKQNHD
jgi:hypothetical protein